MNRWHFYLLLFNYFVLIQSQGIDKKVASQPEYKGPVVCKGTKPLLFREDVNIGGKINKVLTISEQATQKKLFEPYWEQFYQHLLGCQIIVGNLIIPHLHGIPFEAEHINEALKDLQEVTGYIYIYDVDVDINLVNLRVIHGIELLDFENDKNNNFKMPKEFNSKAKDVLGQGYALFAEKFTKELRMPNLKLISRGRIGFYNSPLSCAFRPNQLSVSLLDYYEDALNVEDILVSVKSHGSCSKGKIACENSCRYCYASGKANCQVYNKAGCEATCRRYSVNRCSGKELETLGCCFHGCRGGCTEATSHNERNSSRCVACRNDQYLNWETQKCTDDCDGVILFGTRICLQGKACPDYMFSHSNGRFCSYSCPSGLEYDPARLFLDEGFADKTFDKYWPDASSCRPCKMRFNKVLKDFEDDCGIGCVVSSNSLSFFSILNIYPSYNDIFEFGFNSFDKYLLNHYGSNVGFTDRERCRYIYGMLHLDHNSVGYPADRVRLTPYHLQILTFATSLYGNIRIENTESFWFADMFRNLVAIANPKDGRKHPRVDYTVSVQYNSDLRTVDLQRLRKRQNPIVVTNNPLYIPPKRPNVKNVFGGDEKVETNGLDKTRTEKDITYATGCTNPDSLSYYYGRCLKCGVNEFRYFSEQHFQYFALCRTGCDQKASFVKTVYGEKLCIDCYSGCNQKGCRGPTPYECGTQAGRVECNDNAFRVIDPSMEMCVEGTCPVGFYQTGTHECLRCDKACRNGCSGKEATFFGTNGCKGCGIVYYDFDLNIFLCLDAGVAPRCNQDESCEMSQTNPVYDYWHSLGMEGNDAPTNPKD